MTTTIDVAIDAPVREREAQARRVLFDRSTKDLRRKSCDDASACAARHLITRLSLVLDDEDPFPHTPEGYGAVGDGVADDTVAVRAWIDAIVASRRERPSSGPVRGRP